MLTATDFFCGMGGSSTGLVRAGYDVKVAANHWGVAIETHSANHPDTEHLCADISNLDLRYLPKTDVLWASPICTEVSPAGGRKRRTAQMDLFEEHGHVPTAAFERTRVTFWEVIRATEIHRYPMVLIENVIEAAEWELFDVWLAGMTTLGYRHQFVSVSAAHIGDETNPHAPQWRDRLYIVFNRDDVPAPDVEPRPLAWCDTCGEDVPAYQYWKRPGRRIGKYNAQYFYVCPIGNHGRVEPYIVPAAAAIDWSNTGTRIGDRPRPLAAGTMQRIRRGLDMWNSGELGTLPAFISKQHAGYAHHDKSLHKSVTDPLPTMRASGTHGIVTMLRRNAKPHLAETQPLATFAASGYHHGLVIPFRRGATPYRATEGPLSTMATRDQHGVMHPAVEVEDCHFRMLSPREAANAQTFPRSYVIHGNKGEQQMQAGNAVATNVACWLGEASAKAMGVAA